MADAEAQLFGFLDLSVAEMMSYRNFRARSQACCVREPSAPQKIRLELRRGSYTCTCKL